MTMDRIFTWSALLLGIVNLVVIIGLLHFAGQGGRNTAADGFQRDLQITELQARMDNLERHHSALEYKLGME